MSSKKPQAFGDKYRRCMVSSVAGYEERDDGEVWIFLKSGETVKLKFGNAYLSNLAMRKFDGYFKTDTPENDPCKVCCRKDVPEPRYTNGNTYCTFCNGHGEFKPPGENPHDDEEE